MSSSNAEIIREEDGSFPGTERVHGVTYDGRQVWFASGDKLNAFDPSSGKMRRSIHVAAHAGTASTDSTCFRSLRIASIRSSPGLAWCSPRSQRPVVAATRGLAWAEGSLWVGQYRNRKIHQVDPETGAILRTIESNRFVTGVTWVDGTSSAARHLGG